MTSFWLKVIKLQKLFNRFLRQLMTHSIDLVGLQKLMLIMIRFKESYPISNSSFNLTRDFLLTWFWVRKVVKNLPLDKQSVGEIPIKILKRSKFSFPELMSWCLWCSSVSVHQRHLRFLLKEIRKSILQLNREFMWPYFTNKDMYYSLIKGPTLGLPKTQ